MTASSPPDQPRVTVVLPVWNAGGYLAAAVESIRAQTLADWELLAIDDGSTDGSRQLLDDFARRDGRITVTSRPNRGLAATLQEGIERARSGVVALMNADDVSHPDRLARQLAFLERHPTVAALGTQTRLFVDGHATAIESRLPLSPQACRRFLPVAPPLAHPTVMPGVRRRHPAHRVTPKPGPVTKRLPAGAGPRRTEGSQAGEGQDGFAPRTAAPPPVSPARGPPTDWGELVQVHDRAIFQASPVELPDIDIHSL